MCDAYLCPVCGSTNVNNRNFILFRSLNPLLLAVCSGCGYAWRSDGRNFQDNLSIQATLFDERARPPQKRYTKWPHRPALIRSEIEKIKGKNGTVLDIGCNNGQWLLTLGRGWQKHGVEISSVQAETARKYSTAKVFCGPIELYDAKPDSFDLITGFAVIEHLSDPAVLVTWAYEHLKPGGLLVLMTGDRESETALQMGDKWPLYDCEDHVSYFSARSIRILLQQVGFKIVRQEWRFMYTPDGKTKPLVKLMKKMEEVFGMFTRPIHDHYYCYAQKKL
jgi:SAM-dependent methyltransferase